MRVFDLDETAEAARALNLVQTNPTEARQLAARLLTTVELGSEAGIVASWAFGRAAYELGDLSVAVKHLTDSVSRARMAGRPDLVVQIRTSLAAALVERGNTARALYQLDLAESQADASWLGRVVTQRAFLFHHLGRFDDAVIEGERALPFLRSQSDALGECRLLLNLGIAELAIGNTEAARQRFQDSRDIAENIGQDLIVTAAIHARGAACVRDGQIPDALRLYADAKHRYESLGNPNRMTAILHADLAATYSLCGLWAEARHAAEESLRLTVASGNVVHEAEARLRLAVALNHFGDRDAAVHQAQRASQLFRRGRRPAWAAVAYIRSLEIGETQSAGQRRKYRQQRERIAEAIVVLERNGWHTEALEAHLAAAQAAIHNNELDDARCDLARFRSARTHAAHLLIGGCYLEAQIKLAAGNTGGFTRALRAGAEHTAAFQRTFGATELRVQSAHFGDCLTELGVRVALQRNLPHEVLRWSEERRASALRLREMVNPENAAENEVGRLRVLHGKRRHHAETATPILEGLDDEIHRVEQMIVDSSRVTVGDHLTSDLPVSVRRLIEQLGRDSLASYVESDGPMYAVVVQPGRTTLRSLGPTAPIRKELDFARASIHRLFGNAHTDASLATAKRSLDVSMAELDQLVIQPLRLTSSGAVVLVPCSGLQDVPWGLLPSLAERDHVIAPSATTWSRASYRTKAKPGYHAPAGLIVGPGLDHGGIDGEAVARCFSKVVELRESRASVAASLHMLASHEHVHVAAHGTFRSDNPLFSSLEMADGPLLMLDVQRLASVPRTVVLSSCSAGVVQAHGYGEVTGTALAFLAAGVHSVVAPSTEVPDLACAEVMTHLYDHLAKGATTSDALRSARKSMQSQGPLAQVTAGLFAVNGASSVICQPTTYSRLE